MRILSLYDDAHPSGQSSKWLLTTVLPVLPLVARPSIMYKSKWMHSSLSHTYCAIVKENEVLQAFLQQGQPPHIIQTQWRRTQNAIYNLYDVKPNATDRIYREGLRQRLDGKQGRFRKNLMGKRVDYCARTVIGGDPALALDQVGIPKSIAQRLTIPESVTCFNIEKMRCIVVADPDKIGGALYVKRKYDSERYDLMFVNRSDIAKNLKYGDIVERHLQDNDIVALNRQPSLHKMSIMAMRVKILPAGSVFKMNLSK
jgi:DNA-directed RNA polymerase beta' subunit